MVNSRLLFVTLVFFSFFAEAQSRYMVFFTDKSNTPYSISSPEAYLSERSLERRAHHDVAVSEQDLPVDPAYLSGITSAGAEVYFTTKWMNGALVVMQPELVSTIEGIEYVSAVELVGQGNVLSDQKVSYSVASEFDDDVLVLATSGVQNEMLGADDLRTRGATGKGIFVAVFDGGFNGVLNNTAFENIHLNNQILASLDFVENSDNPYQEKYGTHGTRVLSCIAGLYKDEFTGTAIGVDLILAKTEEGPTEYPIEMYNWLFAAEYADSAGVDIINSSLGYVDFDSPFESWTYTFEDLDGQTSVVTKAANWVSERGVLVVNSAGNSGSDDDSSDGSTLQSCLDDGGWCRINTPSDSPYVLAVGAVESDGETRATFSSFGPSFDGRTKPDVSAMGALTSVANNTGLIIQNSGTSFSSPLMAGFAASLWQAYPELTNAELRAVLRNSGHLNMEPNNELGYGVPRFLEITGELGPPYLLITEGLEGVEVYPNPFKNGLTIENLNGRTMHYDLMDSQGRVINSGIVYSSGGHIEIDDALQQGLYFLVLKSDGFSETVKLLKK